MNKILKALFKKNNKTKITISFLMTNIVQLLKFEIIKLKTSR